MPLDEYPSVTDPPVVAATGRQVRIKSITLWAWESQLKVTGALSFLLTGLRNRCSIRIPISADDDLCSQLVEGRTVIELQKIVIQWTLAPRRFNFVLKIGI